MNKAFTIVELLIVIVVIAILAAVTAVAFNGVNERARKSLLQDALAKVSKQLEVDKVTRGSYATQLSDANAATINGVSYQYTQSGDRYCVTATKGETSMYKCSGDEPVNGVYLGSSNPGSPQAHTDPNLPPLVVEIASSSMSEITVPAQTTPISHLTSIPGSLSPSDTVFVIYNVDFYSHIHGANAGGVQFQQVYRKTMGAAGYQQTVAYMGTGLSGTQTLQTLACYGGNSTTACNTGTNVLAQYMIFVIKGKSSPLTLQFTDTTYGSQTAGVTLNPAGIATTAGDVAFYAYTFYGSNMPTLNDASSPGATWTTASARSRAAARPGGGDDTALGVFHSVVQSSGTTNYSLNVPASGSSWSGSTLFILK